MIIVTGATGALNGATVDHLLEHVSASDIVVAARDMAKAQRFADLGIEVRRADYADAASLPAAFDGADQLLLVSSSDPKADAVSLHHAAIDAATQVGVGRILYTSHQGASSDSPFEPCRNHAATEKLLAASGTAWTSLRNGYYAHSLARSIGDWRETGLITVPVDGPISWTARDDSAEAAAVILAAGRGYDGPVTLTASEAPTFADVAAMASDATGRDVRLDVVGDDAWIAAQVAAGQPEFFARFVLGMYQAADGGFFAATDPLLATLLGREPQTVRQLLDRPAAAQ